MNLSGNQNPGIFEYHDDSFTINLKTGKKIILWSEIERLEGYKVDLFTVDEICLNIVLSETIITISEETEGWELFVKKLYEQFPSIEKDWDWKITQPPFATNFITLFIKS